MCMCIACNARCYNPDVSVLTGSSRYESTSSDDSSSEESSSSGSEAEEDETETLGKNIKDRRNDPFSNEGAEDVKRDVESSGQENPETLER